jgi:hypothetical protein
MPPIPALPQNTILLVEVGSTAHGTGLPGVEDHDEIGVVVESPDQVIGLSEDHQAVMHRTQPKGARSGPGDIDRTLYTLRRFLRLAAAGNPSILMVFWSPVELATPEGKALRALSPAFIGRHVIPRYRGYMRRQGERIIGTRGHPGHGKRGGGQRPELIAEHGYDTKYAMHAARLGFQCIELLTVGRLHLPIQGEPADWLRSVRRGEVPFTEWWDRCFDLDDQMAALADDTAIPSGPDRVTIIEWSIDTHLQMWHVQSGSLDIRSLSAP